MAIKPIRVCDCCTTADVASGNPCDLCERDMCKACVALGLAFRIGKIENDFFQFTVRACKSCADICSNIASDPFIQTTTLETKAVFARIKNEHLTLLKAECSRILLKPPVPDSDIPF